MRRTFGLLFALLLALSVSLSACGGATPSCMTLLQPWATHIWDDVYLEPGADGTTLLLTWRYEGPCLPDAFEIVINDVPIRGDYPLVRERIPAPEMPPTIVFADGSTAYGFSYTTTITFPAGAYYWWVTPYSGDYYNGETSEAAVVRVYRQNAAGEPSCAAEDWTYRTPIEPVHPRNGQVIHTLTPTLIFRDRNPQLIGCYLPWMSETLVFYSQDQAVMAGLNIDAILDAQPDYVWDFDDGYWDLNVDPSFRYYLPSSWTLPEGLSVTQAQGVSADLRLSACQRTYWQVFTYWEEITTPASISGTFHGSPLAYFDIDPSLCETTEESQFPDISVSTQVPAPPIATVLEPANCRSGPSMDYEIRRVLLEGEQYPVIGRGADGLSWVLGLVGIDDDVTWNPDLIQELGCWVQVEHVDVIGDLGSIELVDPSPPHLEIAPTDTPSSSGTNCALYSDSQACLANPECKWDPNLSPASPCVRR